MIEILIAAGQAASAAFLLYGAYVVIRETYSGIRIEQSMEVLPGSNYAAE